MGSRRTAWHRGIVGRALAAAALLTMAASAPPPLRADESEVALQAKLKAVFVFRALKYLTWPDEAGLEGYRLCVHEPSALVAPLAAIVQERTLRGRPVTLVRTRTSADFAGCHALYLSGSARVAEWTAAALAERVVTFGDDPAHAGAGGAITLGFESGRLRFRVNLGTLTRLGVTASSQFLKLGAVEGETAR